MTKKEISSIWKKILPLMYIIIGALSFIFIPPSSEKIYFSYLLSTGIVAGIVCVFMFTHASIKKINEPLVWPTAVTLVIFVIPLLTLFLKMLIEYLNQLNFSFNG